MIIHHTNVFFYFGYIIHSILQLIISYINDTITHVLLSFNVMFWNRIKSTVTMNMLQYVFKCNYFFYVHKTVFLKIDCFKMSAFIYTFHNYDKSNNIDNISLSI